MNGQMEMTGLSVNPRKSKCKGAAIVIVIQNVITAKYIEEDIISCISFLADLFIGHNRMLTRLTNSLCFLCSIDNKGLEPLIIVDC